MEHDARSDELAQRYLALLAGSELLVGVVDDQGRVVDANDAARRRFGIDDRELVTTADVFPPELFAEYYERVRPALLVGSTWRGRIQMVDGDGERFAVDLVVNGGVGPGGEIEWLCMVGLELDPVVRADVSVLDDAWRDARTGLAGEALLGEHLQKSLARIDRTEGAIGVLVVDVRGSTEEVVLARAGDAIAHAVRPGDVVARVRTERFVIVCDPLAEQGRLGDLSSRCRRAVRASDPRGRLDVTTGHTIGRAGDEPDEVLARSIKAAETARRQGPGASRGVVGAVVPHDEARERLAAELAVAISHGHLGLQWSPIVRLDDRAPVAWEAQPTWRSSLIGTTQGRRLHEVARHVDLLEPTVGQMLRRTVAAISGWRERYRSVPPAVHLELPTESLIEGSIIGQLLDATHAGEVEPELIRIKLTDDQLARSPELERAVRWMVAEGLPIVIGDLGAGLSALSTIRVVRPQLIELGASVTAGLDEPDGGVELAAAVAVGRALGVPISVDGVDTAELAALAASHGAEAGQGRWAGRPVHGRTADRRVPSTRLEV
ncbi:MAG: EAL domain-containing protein [Actinomycetota bacterium]